MTTGIAQAAQRLALIIGNSDYTSLTPLANPANDALLMDSALSSMGFRTTVLLNSDQDTMKRAIAQFGRDLRNADSSAVGLFYYAGHGIQADGRNYLVPVGAAPADPADLDLDGVDANWVLRQMESARNATNIVILDACRNNPLAAKHRSVGSGLAPIDAPAGSFIAYATAPGDVAEDGSGKNSPFTRALAEAMTEPQITIEQVFKRVRGRVISETGGRQTPWDSSSLVGDFFFNPTVAQDAPSPVELSLWQSVSKTNDPARLSLFLQAYPDSKFAPEARAMLATAMLAGLDPDASAARSEIRTIEAPSTTETASEPEPAPEPATSETGSAPASAATETKPVSEHEMIEQAQISGVRADYDAYLAAYPEGVFADLARAEIAHLTARADPAPVAASTEAAADPAPAEAASAEEVEVAALPPVGFDVPLPDTATGVAGRSLHKLSRSEPAFPPIEGLPEAYWKEQKCSNCHNWTRENLCRQGTFYTRRTADAVKRIPHPFGGEFKLALRTWAEADCP